MRIDLSIDGEIISILEDSAVFEGGEGRFFRIKQFPGCLLKVLKTEKDFPGEDILKVRLRRMANERGKIIFRKMQILPILPSNVVVPKGLILGEEDSVIALVFPEITKSFSFENLKDLEWCGKNKYPIERVSKLFLSIAQTLNFMHLQNVVVSDFKPQNLLVKEDEVYFIDTESMKIGKENTTGFTWEYADPTWVGSPNKIVDPLPIPTPENDWYSFAIMYFEALTGISPFSGTYVPKPGNPPIEDQERAFMKISVFNECVIPPMRGKPLSILTATERVYFRRIFEKGLRAPFNVKLIEKRCPCSVLPPSEKKTEKKKERVKNGNSRTRKVS